MIPEQRRYIHMYVGTSACSITERERERAGSTSARERVEGVA